MLDKQQIIDWLEQHNITNYTLVPDQKYGYVINVGGDVDLSSKHLTSIPYKFGKVIGKFDCRDNNLTSLANAPEETLCFDCSCNKKLQSLEGGPKIVSESYSCFDCDLRSLKGAPIQVNNFFCFYNKNLTSLEYGPKIVNIHYNCSNCNLLTLKGAPIQTVCFDCSYNNNLTSLEYAPKYTKNFYFNNTNITHLQSNLVVINQFNASETLIKDLLGCPKKCKEYLFISCPLLSLDGLPEQGGYKICLEDSLNVIPINNILKNLMKLQKPIVLIEWSSKNYYDNILSKLPLNIQQKIKKIQKYL